MKKVFASALATTLISSSLLLPAVHSGTESEDQEVDAIFRRMVTAEEQDYFGARKRLLEHGEQVVPFVKSQITHSNLNTRVIALATLGWLEDQPLNETRTTNILVLVNWAQARQGGPATLLDGFAHQNRRCEMKQSGYVRSQDASRRFPAYDTSAAYLMEAALKGVDPEQNEFHDFSGEKRRQEVDLRAFTSPNPGQPTNQEIAQVVAAALLAGVEDKDAIGVLKLLYEKGGRTMRRVAAIGLKRAGIETDEPIDKPVDWWW